VTVASDAQMRAQLLTELGRTDEAIALLSRALATDPDHTGLLEALTEAQLDADPRQALKTAERLIALSPGGFRGNYLAAFACLELGRAKQAIAHSREAVATAPNIAGCHALLAEAYNLKKKFKPAKEAAERALELDPTEISALIARGNVELGLGNWKEAERWYRHALEIEPHNRPAQLNLATVQEAAGKAAPALLTMDGVVRFDPADRDARQHLDAVVYTTLVHVQWIAGLLAFGVLMIRVD
jgi:tetratricopeptide (TPR) repeat protein